VIDSLRIRGLGVIADAELRLHPGLTVLTGETGAGKTMVLTGLGLVLGERADPGRVRPGADRAVAEGLVVLPVGSAARDRVLAAGGSVDEDGTVVLVRSVSAEGRSRAHAGGTAVPAATLAALGSDLVTVHGQADQRRLVQRSVQRELLDAYAASTTAGAHTQLLATHRTTHARLAAVAVRLGALVAAAQTRTREQEMLRHGLAEIAEVDPKPGEDTELAAEQSRLGNAGDLTAAASAARDALIGDETGSGSSVAGALTAATRVLDGVAGLDAELSGLARRVRALSVDAADTAVDLAAYAGSVEGDPVRLAMIGERRAALGRLARRYSPALEHETGPAGPDGAPDGEPDRRFGTESAEGSAAPGEGADRSGADEDPVLRWARGAERRLASLAGADEDIVGLGVERGRLLAELGRTSAVLSAGRAVAAARLASAVTSELADLAMPAAQLSVTVSPRGAPSGAPVSAPGGVPGAGPGGGSGTVVIDVAGTPVRVGASGADDVVIGLEPHPGAGAAPLGQGASGGELSRVMLALEVVLAGTSGTPSYVFDEVDAGIGGRTAVEVGRRLARLAATRQVVVVTHLAQVAAFADRHLVVVKDAAGAITSSGVTEVTGPDRVSELARMMAGHEKSATARAHAAELLAGARAGR